MFERYAIYYTAQGLLAKRGASWLGWNVLTGRPVAHPAIAGLDLADLTETPRTYGFHGTVKPPFRLAGGLDKGDLHKATKALAKELPSIKMDGLKIAPLGRFLALVPTGDTTLLRDTAARVVRTLDGFRAPLSDDELARRRASTLSPAQEQNLHQWGYPHVMDQFRFHMTLTKRMPRTDLPLVEKAAKDHFAKTLPKPFEFDALTLVGQRHDGMFVTIERFRLS